MSLCLDPSALEAVWLAIRTLEDSAHSLSYLADADDGSYTAQAAVSRRQHAQEMLRAADILRGHAQLAQFHVTARHLNNEQSEHGLKA